MRRSVIVGAALAMVLTACSGDQDPEGSGEPAASQSPAAGDPTGSPSATSSPSDDASEPSEGSSAGALGEPFASRESAVNGQKMRVDIYPVTRNGTLAELNFALTNVQDPASAGTTSVQVGQLFTDGNSDSSDGSGDAADGVTLLDPVNSKVHVVASDGAGSCLCTRKLFSVLLNPADTVVLSATYAAPPEDVSSMTVTVPRFGTFSDVPVE